MIKVVKAKASKLWMVERTFKLKSDILGFATTPVRSVVRAKTRKEAEKWANQSCIMALATIGGEGKGEWVGDAVVLYPMAED